MKTTWGQMGIFLSGLVFLSLLVSLCSGANSSAKKDVNVNTNHSVPKNMRVSHVGKKREPTIPYQMASYPFYERFGNFMAALRSYPGTWKDLTDIFPTKPMDARSLAEWGEEARTFFLLPAAIFLIPAALMEFLSVPFAGVFLVLINLFILMSLGVVFIY